jgi:hypothetical protein
MKFPIQNEWFFAVVIFLSCLCVFPLFSVAGLPSPIESIGDRPLSRLIVFVTSVWGIAFFLGNIFSFILTRIFPKKFKPQN